MIDEKKLLEEMCNGCDTDACDGLGRNSTAKCYSIRLIEEQPKVGEWIPLSEMFPEEETEVIVSTKTGVVRTGIYTKRYGFSQREGFICNDGFMWMNTANAWQPLPEPYITKGE